MAYDKVIARHDRVTIDGVDVSNSFREFSGPNSEHSDEDVSGFSESGNDESLPGSTASGFTGTAFYSEDFADLIYPLHANRTPVEIQYQPNGLVDPTARVYYGVCTINQFGPQNTRGTVSTMPFSAKPATADGIQSGAGT